ncbi:MAG: SusC/RagA family TonB-linked outer membrane protein, partial [Alphaproteobacteria bacterium]
IPNLNITFGGGAPGQSGRLNIRGTTSLNGGSPLVLIDGIPGTLDRLSAEEIQSISVLKDAASAAIYGARGAYGVVLITTKEGKKGKTSIRYNNSFGMSTPTVSTDFITTGYDWIKLNDDAFAYGGEYSGYTEADYQELYDRRNDKTEDPTRPWVTIQNRNGKDQYVYYGNYDWYNYLFSKWQPSQNHNINITKGDERTTFMLNGNMKSQDGIMKEHTDKFRSYALRSKINSQLYSWLKISNNTNFYHSDYQYYGRNGGGNSNFTHINVHASPAYAPINPDGTATYITGLNNYDIGDGIFAMLASGNTKGRKRKYELTTTSEAEFTPIKDVRIVANYSYSMYTDPSYHRDVPATYSLYPGEVSVATKYSTDLLQETQRFNQVQVANIYADYNKTVAKHHYFKILLGFNQELHTAKKLSASRYDLLSETLNDLDLATGESIVGGGASEYALQGYFYRLNYDYKGKYLLETNGRLDGTSRFPKDDRFGFFPSISAGWRVSEEHFFEPIKRMVSNLKFRASYGSLGNQSVSSPYPYISTLNPTVSGSYILDGEKAKYISTPTPVSRSLTWEKVTSTNFGIDIGLFNNQLNISFDKYVRNTSGMLSAGEKLPNVFGASQPKENIADLRTKGFELTMGWNSSFSLINKPFRYGLTAILSDSYSYITKINNPTKLTYSDYEGKRLGEIWGYITDGFFKTDAEAKTYPINQEWLNKQKMDYNIPLRAGDLRWVDLNGDGIINSGKNTVDDPGDQKVIGNTTPRYSYGVSGHANWNGIELSFFFQGVGKRDWYPGNNADRFWGPYSRPYYSFIPEDFTSKVWSEDNQDAYFPRLMAYIALNSNNELRATNNKYLQDLAYLRLKNLTISYTIPKSISTKVKIQRFRVFASGENLFTWTKLETDYIDPEQAIASSNARVYPFSKTYSIGFDITF